MNTKKTLGTLLIAMAGAVVGIILYAAVFPAEKQTHPLVWQQYDTQSVSLANYPASFEGSNLDFTMAAEKSVHAVVHVKNTKFQRQRYTNPFYEFFYGDIYRSEPTPIVGIGSGVIISPDGYIVTNNHVVEGADDIEVTLNDKRVFKAEIIGTDPSTDIALLKIKGEDFPFIPFGDSDNLKLGEWVLAVGNPFNLTSTVTAGIVSAKGRNLGILPDNYRVESFIQTDAALNRGNSGGALVNTRGELVGVNTAIISPNGAYAGNSFAVPVNIVKKIVADIIEFGSVQRAVLGVTITDVTDELAKEINLESIEGVYISGVAENGAAQAAGIEPGDVIISINGVKVNSVSELQEQVSRYRPKDKVDVVVKRNNREKQFEVVLRNMEGEARYITAETNVLGAKFRDVDRNLKKRLQIDNGVQITELGEGALQDAGIKNNFVITSIDGEPVESAAQVKNILARQPKGSSVEIEGIYPGGRYIYVYVVKF
ncbi:MAG TPA: Do family serine endopeptidase [Bacteroidetes bacterium]|nr:Do family serine endopeptidase [Bacteroidota bacterium]